MNLQMYGVIFGAQRATGLNSLHINYTASGPPVRPSFHYAPIAEQAQAFRMS